MAAYGSMNHVAFTLSDMNLNITSLCHPGALLKIQDIRNDIHDLDFLVVDVLLQPLALSALATSILYSTIWFDISTGKSHIMIPFVAI
jgi:hypothetical protein